GFDLEFPKGIQAGADQHDAERDDNQPLIQHKSQQRSDHHFLLIHLPSRSERPPPPSATRLPPNSAHVHSILPADSPPARETDARKPQANHFTANPKDLIKH